MRLSLPVFLIIALACSSGFAQTQLSVFDGLKIVIGENDDELVGPNCFNFALYNIGFSKGLTYSSGEEIKEVMNSPACRQLQSSEVTMMGDVGILSKDDEWLHAFSYLNHETVFTKNGMVESSAYRKMAFSKMLDIYSNLYEAECRECKGVQPGDRLYKECRYCVAPVKPQRYRCRQFDEFVTQVTLSPTLKDLIGKTRELEVRSETLYFQKHELGLASARDLNQKILDAAEHFRKAQSNAKRNETYLLNILRHKIEALQLSTEELRRLAADPDPQALQTAVNGALSGDY